MCRLAFADAECLSAYRLTNNDTVMNKTFPTSLWPVFGSVDTLSDTVKEPAS